MGLAMTATKVRRHCEPKAKQSIPPPRPTALICFAPLAMTPGVLDASSSRLPARPLRDLGARNSLVSRRRSDRRARPDTSFAAAGPCDPARSQGLARVELCWRLAHHARAAALVVSGRAHYPAGRRDCAAISLVLRATQSGRKRDL